MHPFESGVKRKSDTLDRKICLCKLQGKLLYNWLQRMPKYLCSEHTWTWHETDPEMKASVANDGWMSEESDEQTWNGLTYQMLLNFIAPLAHRPDSNITMKGDPQRVHNISSITGWNTGPVDQCRLIMKLTVTGSAWKFVKWVQLTQKLCFFILIILFCAWMSVPRSNS